MKLKDSGKRKQERLYGVWKSMRQRCSNPKNADYHNYGHRGITVCKEWGNYENFRDWAKENGYKVGLSIDRINNDGNYEPSNCRWATNKEQSLNKRTNVRVNIDGETLTLKELSEKHGIPYGTLRSRVESETFDKSKLLVNEDTMLVPVIRGDGVEFDSVSAAARSVNGCSGKVTLVCQGKRNKHKGHTFSYRTIRD